MAESLGSAVLTISVDDTAYKTGLNAAKAQATSAADSIASSFRNLASVVGAIGLGVLTQQIIETGKQSQKTKIQIDALTAAYGEQQQATASIERIQSVLGISALEAREGYARLFGALRGAGIGAAQVEVLFVGLTKAALASGAGAQEASAALIQLKQGLASGRLAGDELRSVLENLPVLTQAIAAQMGTTVGQVKQLGAEGKITSDIVFNAAKQVAGQQVRARTEAENLGRAYENLKEQIAAAIGPGIKTLLAGIAAGFATFAQLIADNAGKIKGFVVATIALAKALAPFAAAILTVRAAMVAYQVAAKAAAVAQAAVLALSGPAGWATLAAGLALAAGAAIAIEKGMEGVAGQTKKAKEEYEKYKKQFEGVLSGTTLEGPTPVDPDQEAKTSKEIALNNIKLESIKEQVDATKALAAAEKGVERETLKTIQAIQLGINEAKRREREIGAQIDAARLAGKEDDASRLVDSQRVVAQETRLELEKGALALKEAGEQLRDDLRAGVLEFTRVRSDPQGLNKFLNSQQIQQRAEQDFQSLLPQFREAQQRFTQLTGARAPEFSGSTASVNDAIRDFIERTKTEDDATKNLNASINAANDINKELMSINTRLAEVTQALADKRWDVNLILPNGSSVPYQNEQNAAFPL